MSSGSAVMTDGSSAHNNRMQKYNLKARLQIDSDPMRWVNENEHTDTSHISEKPADLHVHPRSIWNCSSLRGRIPLYRT